MNKNKPVIHKNPAAQALGKLGGLATKKRGVKYYREISKLAQEARKRATLTRNGPQDNTQTKEVRNQIS